jgi:hypothetical protein
MLSGFHEGTFRKDFLGIFPPVIALVLGEVNATSRHDRFEADHGAIFTFGRGHLSGGSPD